MKCICQIVVGLLLLYPEVTAQIKTLPYEHTILVEGKRRSLEIFRGKPMIVELFSSTCVVCFKQLPKLQEMYERYKDKVGFLLLGDDTVRLPKTYERYKRKLNLQFVTGFDRSLFEKMSEGFVPLYYWIDANGIVQAKTSPAEFTVSNIDRFLSGKSILNDMHRRKSFKNDHILGDEHFSYRSMFTVEIDTLESFFPERLQYASTGPFFQAVNVRMADLYRYAYFDRYYVRFGDSLYGKAWFNPIIEGDSVSACTLALDQRYCYSLSFPGYRPLSTLKKTIQADLENYSGYNAALEIRMMPYRALMRIEPGKDILRSRQEKKRFDFTFSGLHYTGVRVHDVLQTVDYSCRSSLPFIDETGIDYPIDIKLEALMTDITEVTQALERNGLAIEIKVKPMKVIVIRPFSTTVAAD